MRVVFRTDASQTIGSGHVARCLVLAQVLRARGAEVFFLCRELEGNLCDFIEARGFAVHRLPTPIHAKPLDADRLAHGEWLGVTWEEDAEQVREILAAYPEWVDWLVVDHYALDSRWEAVVRSQVCRLMAIDDLADRSHVCDLLLDQNLGGEKAARYAALLPQQARSLLGPRYALLRPEFEAARSRLSPRTGEVRRLLVFFGGVDRTNETAKALDALQTLNVTDLAIDVVVGATNPYYADLIGRVGMLPACSLHRQVDNMAELMAHADLAMGAGGSTAWERCCLGLPALMLSVAANQEEIAKACADAGAGLYLGVAADITAERLAQAVQGLRAAPRELDEMGRRAGMLVDGLGAVRVADAMEELRMGG